MAKADPQSNTGLADEADETLGGNNGEPQEPSQQNFTPIAGKSVVVQFNEPIPGIGAVVVGVTIDNHPISGSKAEIKAGSFITVTGAKLNAFDDKEWKLQRQGKDPVPLAVVSGGESSGKWVTLRVPSGATSGIVQNESLGLSFFSSKSGGRRRILPVVFVFEPTGKTEEESLSSGASEAGPEGLNTGKDGKGGGSSQTGSGINLSQILTDSGGQIIGGALGAVKKGALAGTLKIKKDLATLGEHLSKQDSFRKIQGPTRERILKAFETGNLENLSEFDEMELGKVLEEIISGNQAPKSVKTVAQQTVKKLVKYQASVKEKHGASASSVKTTRVGETDIETDGSDESEEVSSEQVSNIRGQTSGSGSVSATQTTSGGGSASVSQTEEAQGQVRTQVSATPGTVKQESEIRGEQTVSGGEGEATVSQTQEVSEQVSEQVQGSGEASAEVKAPPSEVSVEVKEDLGGDAEASSSQVETSGELAGAEGGNLKVSANIQASANVVGEHLDKNNLIPDLKGSRERILNVLSKGDTENLSPEDKELLLKVVSEEEQKSNLPPKVKKALGEIKTQISGGEPASQDSPDKPSKPQAVNKREERERGISPTNQQVPSKDGVRDSKKVEEVGKAEEPSGSKKPKPESKETPLAPPKEISEQLASLREHDEGLKGVPSPQAQKPKKRDASVGHPVTLPSKGSTGAKVPPLSEAGTGKSGAIISSGQAGKNDAKHTQSEALATPEGDKSETSKQPQIEDVSKAPSGAPIGPEKPVGPELDKPTDTEQAETPQEQPEEQSGGKPEESQEQAEPDAFAKAQEIAQNREGTKGFNLKEAEKIINTELDLVLNQTAFALWAGSLPSFGLTILAGAILGDILWVVGPKIFASSAKVVQWVIKKVPALPPGLKDKLDVKNLQLRLGWKAKAHIVAMNLVVIVLVFLFVVILIAVFWGICNSKITYLARQSYGLESYCKSLQGGFVDRGLNSVTGGSGQFQASYNTPGGLMGTQSWTTQINTYAQKHNIDACILRVVVQKESAGIANVIGCDCRANGRGELCLEPATTRAYYSGYKFNWNACSYGIGITQWTIFPIGGSGYRAWKDSNTPSRSIMNNWYTVNELLDPNTSLDLTAKYFGENLKKSNGDVRSAFVVYVGQSSQTERLVNDRMALYNLCKGQ